MIELPFALPTAVAGISLTSLTSDKGLVEAFLQISVLRSHIPESVSRWH